MSGFLRAAYLAVAPLILSTFSSEPKSSEAPLAPADKIVVEPSVWSPTQQEIVQAAADEFRQSFIQRVQIDDRSSPWNACFSTLSQKYNPKIALNLRKASATDAYAQAAHDLFNSDSSKPKYELTGFLKYGPINDWDSQPIVNKPIVIIDFGHGQKFSHGYETGAEVGGVQEARVVDAVAVQLEKILRNEYGVITVTTRMPLDQGYSLSEQTHFRNQEKSLQIRAEMATYLRQKFPNVPQIFLSIHANRAVDENQNIISGVYGGLVFSFSPTESGSSGSKLSSLLAREIAKEYTLRKRSEARTNDYAVLRCQIESEDPRKGTAAALAELGFVTNPQDRAIFQTILSSDETAGKYASQIAKGIGNYLSSIKPQVSPQPLMAFNQ